MEEKEVVVGIDLGTTNSCIAIWDKYKVEVIPNDYGERTTPSIVHFFDQENYDVGSDAKIFLNSEPKSTIYSIKRIIGLDFTSEEVEKFKKDWPFNLVKQDRNKIGIEIEITKQSNTKFIINPESISCYILKKLKSDAENFLKGKSVKKAVVAVPHYFNNSQKEATKTGYLGVDANDINFYCDKSATKFIVEPSSDTTAINSLADDTSEKQENGKFFDGKQILIIHESKKYNVSGIRKIK